MRGRRMSLWALSLFCMTLGIGPARAQAANEPCVSVPGVNDRCPTWTGVYSTEVVDDVPMDVVAGGSGVYSLGYTVTEATGIDWTLVANDTTTGARRWAATFRTEEARADLPETLAVDPAGSRVFATGYSCLTTPDVDSCDLVVVAYDAANGGKAWQVVRDGSAHLFDAGGDLVVSPDGETVYIAGTETRPGTGADALLLALDAATGDELWAEHYDGADGWDAGHALALSADGSRAYLMAQSTDATKDYATIAFGMEEDEVGQVEVERLWTARRDDHGGQDAATAIGVAAGNVIVTGTTDEGIGGLTADYATVAYDERTGEEAWASTYNGGTADLPLDLATSGGAVYVTGMSRGASTGYDMATVGYDAATGAQKWASRYHGPGNNGDAAWAVDVSPDGQKVYVGGDTVVNPVDYLHAVIAYDAGTGTQSWVGLHRGAGPGGGSLRQGLDVGPTGRVFYTGRVLGVPGASIDFLTLAYDS